MEMTAYDFEVKLSDSLFALAPLAEAEEMDETIVALYAAKPALDEDADDEEEDEDLDEDDEDDLEDDDDDLDEEDDEDDLEDDEDDEEDDDDEELEDDDDPKPLKVKSRS